MKELWKNFKSALNELWKNFERSVKEPWISLELPLKEQKCDGVSEWVCDWTGSREASASKNEDSPKSERDPKN